MTPVPKPTRNKKPRKQLRRRAPMRKRNAKRARESYARNYGERGDPVRAMPCLLAARGECSGPIEAAHAKARGMGGRGGDRRDLVPLCRADHRRSHTMSAARFAEIFGVDLRQEARRIAGELDEAGVP